MRNKTLSDIGEIRTLRRLWKRLPTKRDVRVGAGDDCAVVGIREHCPRAGARRSSKGMAYDLLLKSDPVIQGVHFTLKDPAEAVGHKALGRVLSDIAAMGGEPLWALVDVVAPARTPVSHLDRMYRALSALARRYNIAVVGGDLAHGRMLEVHVFGVGRVPKGKAVLRSGAKPGHRLFVTGSLGGSRSGKHLSFRPRVAEGRWLREGNWASSMIDLSDGLASDIRHLTDGSRTGVELVLDSIPLSKAVLNPRRGYSGLHHALTDGEDFELLFTVPNRKTKAFQTAWERRFDLACTCIGAMTARRGVIECVDGSGRKRRLDETGYDHFS